jgi:hypothetical protein
VERTVRRGIRSSGHRTVANSLHTHGDDPIFREVKGTCRDFFLFYHKVIYAWVKCFQFSRWLVSSITAILWKVVPYFVPMFLILRAYYFLTIMPPILLRRHFRIPEHQGQLPLEMHSSPGLQAFSNFDRTTPKTAPTSSLPPSTEQRSRYRELSSP